MITLSVKTVVSRDPIFEDKWNTSAMESKKMTAWESICN